MATELADGIWQLRLTGVNAYLLAGDELVLVDAGTPFDGDKLRSAVSETGHVVSDVDCVLVTHFDIDHVGGLAKLSELSAPIHMPGPDAGYLTGESSPPLSNRKGLMHRAIRPFVGHPDQPIEAVLDGDEFGNLTAYRTPGHTPGHTAYVSEDRQVAFLGDAVIGSDRSLSVPPWFLNYDTDGVKASIRSLARRAPVFEVAAQGHGTPIQSEGRRALTVLAESLQ